jgi:hypothetical protein
MFSLATMFRGLCGPVDSRGGVYSTRRGDVAANAGVRMQGVDGSAGRTLRELPAADVLGVVAYVQRRFGWRLPGDGPVVDRIDAAFAEARSAKIASTAARW